MMSIFYTLLTPLLYLKISHSFKNKVDLIFLFVSLLFSFGFVFFCPKINLFGSSGFVPSLNSFMGSLSGFFITGLAAVATFQGGIYNIDKPFNKESAFMRGNVLSRRQFLCYLFGYLAFSSIIFSLFGIFSVSYANTPHHIDESYRYMLKAIFEVVYSCWLGHIIGTTLVGLVFLTDRMSHSSGDNIYTLDKDV